MEISEQESQWIYANDLGWYFGTPFDDEGIGPYETKEAAAWGMRFYGSAFDETVERPDMGKIPKPLLQEALRDMPFRITFTKKDGSERVLRGTLNLETIKECGWVPDETKESKPSPDHLLNVFDLDINEWRYLTISNIKDIK